MAGNASLRHVNKQIKSKERVAEHGEVFTNEREVNAMLDMVKQETERIESRFWEPACGNGNFLAEVLNRKLAVVKKQYSKSVPEYEKYSILALSSIYGVDIMEDNAKECRTRLYDIWNKAYTKQCKAEANNAVREAASFIIRHNILYGDTLAMLCNDGEPIVFAQWDLVSGNKMKRRDYRLDQLMKGHDSQMDLEMLMGGWEFDEETQAWIPSPIKEYPLMNYWEVQDHAYEFIPTLHPEGSLNMKFDVICGNPPFQLSDGGARSSASPVYQLFVQQAMKLNPRYITMIMPARWYAGGKGLDSFRNNMLNDIHLKELHDYPITRECFPGVNIRGGVCYFLWAREYDNKNEKVKVTTHMNGEVTTVCRDMKYKDFDIFIRHEKALSILDKVVGLDEGNMLSSIVSSRKPFGLTTDFSKTGQFHESEKGLKSPLKCIAKGKTIGFVEKSCIHSHEEWINAWKVMAPRANNIGTELNDDNLNAFVAAPGTVCTESYIVFGGDAELTQETAQNMVVYLQTKFARFCNSLAKISQDATSKTYRFVPMQNFNEQWTDEKLYKKYNLTKQEVEFIEDTIMSMD